MALALLLLVSAFFQLSSARTDGSGPSPGVSVLSTVFSQGLNSVACYRIPSVVITTKGTVLAFSEARHGSCSDGAVHAIAVRRSVDQGKTWSDVGIAAGGDNFFVGNPDAVVTNSGKILLVFVKHAPKCQGDCGIGNALVESKDDGLTWSKPVDLSAQWAKASGSLPGPGVALQSSSGRLLVVSHHSAYQEDYVTISDDDGNSWKTVNTSFKAMDEAQITQLPNGSLMLNMRHQSSKTVGRGVSISHDDGSSWSPITFNHELISPVCQASIVTIQKAVYFSNPDSTITRANTTVKKSLDNGITWDTEPKYVVEPEKSAGYSCLLSAPLVAGRGGILYESTNMTIRFASFPL